MQELFIPLRMPGLNDFLSEAYRSRYAAGATKRQWTETVAVSARAAGLGHFTETIQVEFHWYEPNKKRDKDNVAFAKKFILDGLQMAGVITNDNNTGIDGFSDHFHYEGKKEGVKIIMMEVQHEPDNKLDNNGK